MFADAAGLAVGTAYNMTVTAMGTTAGAATAAATNTAGNFKSPLLYLVVAFVSLRPQHRDLLVAEHRPSLQLPRLLLAGRAVFVVVWHIDVCGAVTICPSAYICRAARIVCGPCGAGRHSC